MPNPTTITDNEVGGLLKNLYANIRLKLQNISTPLVSQLKKVSAGGAQSLRWGGNDLFWNVKVGRPSGGTFSPQGFFPPDTTALERQARVGVKRAYVTRVIDGLAFVGTQSKSMAFETILSKTYDEIKSALFLLQQQSFHNKADGVMALASGTMADALTLVAISPYGVAGAGQAGLLFAPGDYIAVLDTGSADAVIGRGQIESIVNSGDVATITLVAPGIAAFATTAATDKIVKATTSDTSFNAATNGLIGIMNRGGAYGPLHGIDPSVAGNAIWNTVRMAAGTDTPDASAPSEDDIWTLAQRISGLSGKSPLTNPDQWLLLTTPGLQQKFITNLASLRRFDGNSFTKKVNGGYNAVSVSGMDCIADYYVPAGTVYLIHKPSLGLVDGKDAGYVEFEGAGPWRWVNGRDAFETTYSWYGELATLARNAHGMITGYTDAGRFTHVL
jgi:hypothetical protein